MNSFIFMVLFIKLFFVLLLCHLLCVPVFVGSEATTEVLSAELFEADKIKTVQNPGGIGDVSGDITFTEIRVPLFFAASNDSVIVAAAEAKYTKSGDKYGVLTKYFETNKNKWKKDDIKTMIEKWKTQLATENGNGGKAFSTVMASVVNAAGDKIYIFLLHIPENGDDQDWEFKVFKGTISTQSEKNSPITWNAEDLNDLKLAEKIKQTFAEKTSDFETINGYAFLTEEKNILFVVTGKSSKKTHKTVFFVFEEQNGNSKLKLLFNEKTLECYSSFFQWGKEIFKAPTDDSNDSNKKLMVFDVGQKTFAEKDSSIARLQGFLKDKHNFATAAFGSDNVLLFTQEKPNGNKDGGSKNDLHLWMTDGSRVGYVGTIITGFTGPFDGSVLYTKDELFALHQKYNTGDRGDGSKDNNKFTLNRLKGQLSNITKILEDWNNNNDEIKTLFQNTATTTPPGVTDGLVGYLSGDGQDKDKWKDKYLNVNAAITPTEGSAKKVENGLEFSGVGVGAQWSVGEEKDQPYSFINSGFTLVTIVTVGSVTNNKDNSIFGVGLTDDPKFFSLWCTRGGKWGVKVGNSQKEITSSAVACKREKKYHIGLILKDTNLSVYVDGEKLTYSDNVNMQIDKSKTISHFYFGVNNKPMEQKTTETNVTIKTVLLYNRPFTTDDEILSLKPKQNVVVETHETAAGDPNKLAESEKTTTETDTQPTGEAPTENDDMQSPSPSPTTEDSAARVGVVGVLCFMLFGVFTLLGRYVY